ncbi:MAG: hypothetical protein HY658_05410 [Actinobacteria bacterium]|nr:hypothetical protein [Actinomycetota bacterium]
MAPPAGILVATDTGLFAAPFPGGSPHALHDRARATALARGRDAIWAVIEGTTVSRLDTTVRGWEDQSGTGWEDVAGTDPVRANCLLPLGEDLLVGTSEAHVLRLTRGRVDRLTSFDDTAGREGWHTPWGGPPDVRSMAAGADGTILANVHVGGIVRSRDGGSSWEPTIDIHADVHQVIAHPTEPGAALAASARGLELSLDGGDTWTTHADGLHASYARAVAVAGDTVLLSASTGPFTRRAALYRAPFSDRPRFEPCETGLPEWFGSNLDTHCLAASGRHAALGTADGELYVSADAGMSWDRVAEDLGTVRAVLLTA